MSRKNIISKIIAGEIATQVDLRVINMPLYPITSTGVNVFYGYYKAGSLRIEDADAEGNDAFTNLVSADSKTALLNAIIASVGAVIEATLSVHQLNDSRYYIKYKQAGGIEGNIILIGSYFTEAEDNAVKDQLLSTIGATEVILSGVTKIGITTDQHWDAAESYAGRDQALVHLDNFKTQMIAYAPDLILEGGDKVGAVTLTSATRLTYMQDVSDKMQDAATAAGCSLYRWGWGNHDFDYNSFASVQGKYSGEIGLVSGSLYGYWEDANYRYISLDSNYSVGTQNHLSNQHNGFGYINTDQIAWLEATLANSAKQCIIMCHHPLCELDTERIFLTKETYHTQNRAAVRAVLEDSGKVLFALHGHCHITAHNVINGIPYLVLADLNIPPATTTHWDTPNSSVSGKWGKIEIDRDLSEIRFLQEVRVSGVVQTIYQFNIPFFPVYNNAAVDAAELYINDDLFVIAKPCSLLDSDPRLSSTSIKIQALTNAADYGRVLWSFTPQTTSFEMAFSARLASQTTKYFKVHNTSSATSSVYFGFHTNGNLFAYNGATLTVLQTYSLNTWYSIRVLVNIVSSTFSIYVNGVLVGGSFAFNNANTTLKQVEIVTETGNLFIDTLRLEN